MAACALSIVLLPQVAVAHDSEMRGGRYVWTSSNFCVRGTGYQNHGYSGMVTYTEGPCSYVKYRDPGYIKNRAVYFKGWPGQAYNWCLDTRERSNGSRTAGFQTHIGFDVWQYCNFGWWVNVDISMDTWHWAAYGSYWYPNYGGEPGIRPTTHHCHCP